MPVDGSFEPANEHVIAGGSNRIALELELPSENGTLIVGVRDADGTLLPGTFELPLSVARGVETFGVFLSRQLPEREFDLLFATRSNGVVSPARGFHQRPFRATTGLLQISLAWKPDQDLDLFLGEPGRNCPGDLTECIFFDRSTSPGGGRFEFDSNSRCRIDGVDNENIVYPGPAPPPSGVYRVFAGMTVSCDGRGAESTIVVNRGDRRTAICARFAAATEGRLFEVARFDFPNGDVELPATPFAGVEIRFCGD